MDPQALRACPLFQGLTPEQLRKVAGAARHRDLAAGEVLFRAGEAGHAMYVVVAGKVRISRRVAGGEEALTVLEPGTFFGELALVDEAPRSADAVAHSACALAELSRDALDQLMFVDRDLAHALLWSFVRTLALRLRETNDKLEAALTLQRSGF